jgi:hypothetical protein
MSKRRIIGTLIAMGVSAAACDTLYGLDSARRSLQHGDSFQVDPTCPELIVDPNAPIPRVVTLTGRRGETGLGAESVPVVVQLGFCDRNTPVAGLSAADNAGAGGVGSSDGGVTVGVCSTLRAPLNATEQGLFELVAQEGRGCRQRSPARLDCTLDASGEAAFGIVGRPPETAADFVGYLPICATPLELEVQEEAEASHEFQIEMVVTPRVGTARSALAVMQVDGDVETAFADASDCTLVDCDSARRRGGFRAGFVSSEIPAGMLRSGDFIAFQRESPLLVSVTTLEPPSAGPTPFLSTDPTCATATAEDLSLVVAKGKAATDVFYLCAPSFGSSVEVSAALDTSKIPDQEETDAPVQKSKTVDLDALVETYLVVNVEDQFILMSETCEGARTDAASVRVLPPWSVFGDSTEAQLQCGLVDRGEGGAAGMGGAPNMMGMPECTQITLDLGSPRGTCTIQIPN